MNFLIRIRIIHISIFLITVLSGCGGSNDDPTAPVPTEDISSPTPTSSPLPMPPAVLTSLTVTPSAPRIAAGTTQQFIATGIYSDNSTQDLTASVTWSASNTVVAQISDIAGSKGLATGIASGTTTISAVSGNISGTAALFIIPATPPAGMLSWNAPTVRVDGSPVLATDIKEYRVYVATSSGAYNPQAYYAVPASATSVDISTFNLPAGQYYFVSTSVDLMDRESDFSNEVALY